MKTATFNAYLMHGTASSVCLEIQHHGRTVHTLQYLRAETGIHIAKAERWCAEQGFTHWKTPGSTKRARCTPFIPTN